MIGDQSGTSKVTQWEEHVDSLVVERSYRLKNFVVREYALQKYLSMPMTGALILPIDNIGGVAEAPTGDTSSSKIFNVKIVGILALDCYNACLKYARVEPLTPHLVPNWAVP